MLSDLELLIACLILASGLPIAFVLRRKSSARPIHLLALGALCCGVAVSYGVNGEPLFPAREFVGEVEIIGDDRGSLPIIEDGVVAEFDLQQGDGVSLPHDFTPFSADRYPTRDLLPPADDTYLTPDIAYGEVTHRRFCIITDINFCRLRESHSPPDIQRRGLTAVSPVHAEMSYPIVGRHLVPVVEFLDSRRYPGPALSHGISGDSQSFLGGVSSTAGVVQGYAQQQQTNPGQSQGYSSRLRQADLSAYIEKLEAQARLSGFVAVFSGLTIGGIVAYVIHRNGKYALVTMYAVMVIGFAIYIFVVDPMFDY